MAKLKVAKNELEEIIKGAKKEEFDLKEFISLSKKVRRIIEEEKKERRESGQDYGTYLW